MELGLNCMHISSKRVSGLQRVNCTARQCSQLKRKFMECSIISPALLLLMKHLIIGQRQKAPNFSAFH